MIIAGECPTCATDTEQPPPVEVVGALHKLNGCSQPSIVRCSDGELYVIKFHGFPGAFGLMNEVVGSELVRRLGLPGPDWRPLMVTDEFLADHPELWYRAGNRLIRPIGNLHFGSRLVFGETEDPVYHCIPPDWWDRVENRIDFIAMMVTDMWMNNCDRRQAVFAETLKDTIRAFFIDHDQILGGRFGDAKTCAAMVAIRNLSSLRRFWDLAAAERWESVIERLDEGWILSTMDAIPREWAPPSWRSQAVSVLLDRRRRLAAYVRELNGLMASRDDIGSQSQTTRAVCATVPYFWDKLLT